jgi:rfaE bifunctional protein kinase chain/domain
VDSAQLLALIDALRGRKVAVIGDVVADEFVYGRIARVSREAPVLILEYDSTEVVAGAGGNAANNVAALGGVATLAAVIGDDDPAQRLLESLHAGVDRRYVKRQRGRRTTIKTRILAGGIHSAKQQVVRIDRVAQDMDGSTRDALEKTASAALRSADAVIVSDYGSGLISPRLARRLRAVLKEGKRPIPVLVDTRYRLLDYRGLTACTPNESEVEQALGVRINDDLQVLEGAGREILQRTGMGAVLITRGSRGMALFVPRSKTLHIPIVGSDEIADVTGAGDTVMATMALALAAGASFEAAAHLANHAGSVVVMKRGTATVGADELRASVKAHASPVNVGVAFRRPKSRG